MDSDDKIIDYLEFVHNRHSVKFKQQGINLKDFRESMFKQLKNNLSRVQNNWETTFFIGQDEQYGIFSLSGRWNSILMWGHYSACHTGFCVGFNEKKLRAFSGFHRGGVVNYVDDFPFVHPKQDMTAEFGFLQTFTKAKDWSYEQEYRLFTFGLPKEGRVVCLYPSHQLHVDFKILGVKVFDVLVID